MTPERERERKTIDVIGFLHWLAFRNLRARRCPPKKEKTIKDIQRLVSTSRCNDHSKVITSRPFSIIFHVLCLRVGFRHIQWEWDLVVLS